MPIRTGLNSGLVVPTLALDETWDKTTNPALAISSRIASRPGWQPVCRQQRRERGPCPRP